MRRAPIPHATESHRLTRADAQLARALAAQIRRTLTRTLFPLPAGEYVPLRIERAAAPIAPAVLAAAHPGGPGAQATMRGIYESCLAHYRAAAGADSNADDVGAAMADFVAANLQALAGAGASRPMLAPVERQLAAVLRGDPAWGRADAAERQCMFEKFAILAVFVASCAAQAAREGPAALTNVRNAARGYLREFLGVDPARLAIGPEGLRLTTA